jgi:hypothetical protein
MDLIITDWGLPDAAAAELSEEGIKIERIPNG